MTCNLKIVNDTPRQFFRSPNNQYQIFATLAPQVANPGCSFKDQRMYVAVDRRVHAMTRVHPSGDQWTSTHTQQGGAGFDIMFGAIYRFRESPSRIFVDSKVRYPANGATIHVPILPIPQVFVSPTELMFYFDAVVPNTDQTTVLTNNLLTSVQVTGASIPAAGGDEAFFALVSPTTFPVVVPRGGTQNFDVRFTNSTRQRQAYLVINTDHGGFNVRLSGKYFLW
jgi:hypothetical protein